MSEETMIERAADAAWAHLEAAYQAGGAGAAFVDRRAGVIDGAVDMPALVRGVIAAMREPTETMLEEMAGVIPCAQGAEEGPPNYQAAKDAWQEGINAALAEAP